MPLEPLDTFGATILDLNKAAPNKRALEMLVAAGETPDESCLHLVQLALWGIERGGVEADPAVVETLRAMPGWTPARLMNFFFRPGGRHFPVDGWEAAETPLDLAKTVLTAIDLLTFSAFPCYRSGE